MRHFKNLIDLHQYAGIPRPEHPMFSLYRCTHMGDVSAMEFTSDCYIIGFKKLKSGIMMYGRTQFDHQAGSLMFTAPRQILELINLEAEEDAFLIFIHEDYLQGHQLRETIEHYGYFDYEANEALHLSPREEKIVWDLYDKIEVEYHNNPDEYSKEIILAHVESILKYAQRFYKRQFIDRETLSGKMVTKFNAVLADFAKTNTDAKLPTVSEIASQMNVSPRYLSDLLKQETGKTAMELIHIHLIGQAKDKLRTDEWSVSEIAYHLGFESLSYFSKLFKKQTGFTPKEFKKIHYN